MGSNINGSRNHGIQFVLIFEVFILVAKNRCEKIRKIEVLDSYVNGRSFLEQ